MCDCECCARFGVCTRGPGIFVEFRKYLRFLVLWPSSVGWFMVGGPVFDTRLNRDNIKKNEEVSWPITNQGGGWTGRESDENTFDESEMWRQL